MDLSKRTIIIASLCFACVFFGIVIGRGTIDTDEYQRTVDSIKARNNQLESLNRRVSQEYRVMADQLERDQRTISDLTASEHRLKQSNIRLKDLHEFQRGIIERERTINNDLTAGANRAEQGVDNSLRSIEILIKDKQAETD